MCIVKKEIETALFWVYIKTNDLSETQKIEKEEKVNMCVCVCGLFYSYSMVQIKTAEKSIICELVTEVKITFSYELYICVCGLYYSYSMVQIKTVKKIDCMWISHRSKNRILISI